jgi:hypothetical protein
MFGYNMQMQICTRTLEGPVGRSTYWRVRGSLKSVCILLVSFVIIVPQFTERKMQQENLGDISRWQERQVVWW